MMTKLWLTNDPVAAAKLKAADPYVQARKDARHLPLAIKIGTLRNAQKDWERVYSEIRSGL